LISISAATGQKEISGTLDELIEDGILDPSIKSEKIVLPIKGLFIEALTGKHPLLESFKLDHREIDVHKAVAEHRSMLLENIRSEARLLKLELEDPNTDKYIKVDGVANESVTVSIND
jgi:hypothetical protein